MTFENFKIQAQKTFRAAKHPDDVLKNTEFIGQLAEWYNILTNDTLIIYGCGVCLFEKYSEIISNTDASVQIRKAMKYIIKENEVIFHKNVHYSRKSPHLCSDVMTEIAEQYPDMVELNPNYIKPAKETETSKPEAKKETVQDEILPDNQTSTQDIAPDDPTIQAEIPVTPPAKATTTSHTQKSHKTQKYGKNSWR